MQICPGACGSVDGWGTYTTSRKGANSSPDEVTAFFSIYLILPAAPTVPDDLAGDKTRPERKADNLTAICEPIF
jgi:hypothetical protein